MSVRRRSPLALAAALALGLAPLARPVDARRGAGEDGAPAAAAAYEEALEQALEALERAPESAGALRLAAQCARDAGRPDEALWYARLALERVEPGKGAAGEVEALTQLAAELDPLASPAAGDAPTDAWADALFDLAKAGAGRKLWVTAFDLFSRLEGTALGERAGRELEKLYGDKRASAALLESGLAVPKKLARGRKSPAELAKADAEHSTWETRWKLKGDNYTLESDMAFETVEAMSTAMEQMNRFYRQVFHVKERGGDTARVTIKIYRSREEFDRHESSGEKPIPPSVRGFFSPSELKVVTYDHRTDGLGLAFTWSTLFHEASHQFTHLISADLVPAWLNEGTASYFEGARLRSNGSIETNLVPDRRLGELAARLGDGSGGPRAGEPTLKDVVSFYQPGSYEGSYYPFGWGLVYFLHNYEDERCTRPYVPIYQDYLASYKTGGKHDPFQRFVDFFVVEAKQPGVTTFEAFDARWQAWIRELHRLHFGPPACADDLVARGRRERAAKQDGYAIESLRWALRKRPGDVAAHVELGEIFAARKDKDRALYHVRAALEALASRSDPGAPVAGREEEPGALLDLLDAKLVALDRDFAAALGKARAKHGAAVEERARTYVERGFPRAALALVDLASRLDGPSAARAALRQQIEAESGATLARWRRLPLEAGLAGWDAAAEFRVEDGVLVGESRGRASCEWTGELRPRYRFEVRVANPGASGIWGAEYSVGPTATCTIMFFPDGHATLVELGEQDRVLGFVPPIDASKRADFRLAIERGPAGYDFFVDGEKIVSRAASGDELAGGLGLFQHGATVRFSEPRLLQE